MTEHLFARQILARTSRRKASTLVLTIVTALMISGIYAPANAATTVSVTVDCGGPVSFRADVGDTIVFNLTAPGCLYDAPRDEMWNVWNINDDTFPPPAGTGSGYLAYVSGGQVGSLEPNANARDDWFVATEVSGNTTVTTTLIGTNDNGRALAVGDIVATINNAYWTHSSMVFHAITWLGPPSPSVSTQSWSSTPVSTYEVAVGADRSVYVTTPNGVLAFSWNSSAAEFNAPPRVITPPASGTGSTLKNPEGIAVSPDGSQIAVAYDGDGSPETAGVAVYPASASGPTTPVRIVGQPAGASLNVCSFGVRGVAWDASGAIYVAACGYSGANGWSPSRGTSSGDMEVWVFPSSAASTDAPSRVIGPFTGWGEFTHVTIVGTNLAVTGSGPGGRPVAFIPLGSSGSGAFTSSDEMYPNINPNFGFTADGAGRMYVSSFDTPGKVMAFAANSRGASTAVQVVASGVPHSVLGFDPVDGSLIAVEWGGACCSNGIRDTSAATAEIRRIAIGGALPTPTSSPSSAPTSSSTPAASSPGTGGDAPAVSAPEPSPSPSVTSSADGSGVASEASASPDASAITLSAGVADVAGLRLIARGSTGRTCLGSQCVTGRRWALQMCLPNEASIQVQRLKARRWTSLPARQMNLAPLDCPAPTRNATVAVPRRSKAGVFRILLRIEGAPTFLSNIRVT